MNGKPDLKITQTEEPAGRWCSSGHFPPENFVLDGYVVPMRFFKIESSNISGTFCELCLKVANRFKKKR